MATAKKSGKGSRALARSGVKAAHRAHQRPTIKGGVTAKKHANTVALKRGEAYYQALAMVQGIDENGDIGISPKRVAEFNRKAMEKAMAENNSGVAGQTFQWVKNRCPWPVAPAPMGREARHNAKMVRQQAQEQRALGARNPYAAYFNELLAQKLMWDGTAHKCREASAFLVTHQKGYIVARLIAAYKKGLERSRLIVQPRDPKTNRLMTNLTDNPMEIGWQLAKLLKVEVEAILAQERAIALAEKQEREAQLKSRRSDKNLRKALRKGLREDDYADDKEYAI